MDVHEPIIDYLRVTAPSHDLPEGIEKTGEVKQHFFGYDRAEGIAINGTAAGVFMTRSEGAMLQLSGKELEALRHNREADENILRIFTAGYRVARIDFAIDVTGVNPEKIISGWIAASKVGGVVTRSTTFSEHSTTKKEITGSTFEVGYRGSEKVFRGYNKGVESGIFNDWLRLELEVKGKPARVAPELIEKNGLQATTRAYFDSFMSIKGFYTTVMKKLKYAKLPKIERNREADDQFFDRVIVPYLEKRIDTLPNRNVHWMQQFIELREKKHGNFRGSYIRSGDVS